MATTIEHDSPADALLLLQSLLNGLLQWLEPGREEGHDPAYLDPLLDEALNQAGNARLYGVSALLRIWSSAMTQRVRDGALLSAQEKALVHGWFADLQRYCHGDLDESGQRSLLDRLADMPNLAVLPMRLRAYLLDRLQETRPYIHALLIEMAPAVSLPEFTPVVAMNAAIDTANAPTTLPNEEVFWGHSGGEQATPAVNIVEGIVVMAHGDQGGADDLLFVATPPEMIFDAGEDSAQFAFATPIADAVIGIGEIDPFTVDQVIALNIEPAPPAQPAITNEPIWISPEEVQLALDAVGNQVLPSVCALAETDDKEARAALMAELEYNLGLVGNAMEMLGTPALSHGILAMQSGVASGTPPAPEDLTNWSAALVAFLEQPSAENAELLTVFSAVLPDLDEVWAGALQLEAARIRFGLDPKLLAARKILAMPEDVALEIAADVLPNVREGMLRELPGNAERLGNAIRRLVATGDTTPIEEARRVAHTLKGDANTVGVGGLANLSHTLEDLLMELYKHPERLLPALGQVLDQAADCIEEIADYLLGRGPSPANVLTLYQSLIEWNNAVADDALPAQHTSAQTIAPHSGVAVAATEDVATFASAAPAIVKAVTPAIAEAIESPHARTATLTVSASLLDELQRLAGETLVMARQIDQRLAVLETMHREQVAEVRNSSGLLGKLDDLISLRGAALQSTALRGGSAVDPLELDQYNELHVVSRRLLESNADNNEYQRRLDGLLVELESLRGQQEAVHADLQRMVQRARTVPFDQISGRLQRIVRQTARQLDRQVDLQLMGTSTLLDADLLDRIVEPLGHLLRNAIDHGLEDADIRRAVGKPETGTIQIALRTVADSIEIEVKDNGRGLDFAAIRSKGIALGVLEEDTEVSEPELARLILTPGFTTRQEATQVSGRGIGMDVVNQRVIDLRGQLSLSSIKGQGLTINMRLPVSQTMANVIIAHGHDLILGAVAGSVERVHNFSAAELRYSDDGQISVVLDNELIPVYPIETLYGRNDGRLSLPTTNGLGLVVQSARGKRVLVSVSSIGEVSNVIVKPISLSLPPIPSVRGMTLLGDGRLAAVVDMGTLIDVLEVQNQGLRLNDLSMEQVQLPRVVVADDSLSVRRALAELMEDAGYEVSTARDGLEALELVNSIAPALVLLDLEMPKLNGLEVTRFMRGRAQTRAVPVVMITSRASEKYRVQAEEAGVTLMLGKPFSEDELIVSVRRLMAEQRHPIKEEPAALENL